MPQLTFAGARRARSGCRDTGFGIRTGFGNVIGPQTSGNHILKNVAKGNPLADLSQVDGENSWNDNNRCNTEDGTVPAKVCDPSE